MIDDFFLRHAEANFNGTLTVGTALINNYYRLRNGVHAGRVIIKTCSKIDDREICFFANQLTWIHTDAIKDVLCEITRPTFSPANHPIDRSEATWYTDSGEQQFYEY